MRESSLSPLKIWLRFPNNLYTLIYFYMTQKDIVLESIKQMDMNRLQLVLDHRYTYFGATKEMFLNKLNKIFEVYQKKGDNILDMHKAFCPCKICNLPNRFGFTFLGNVSRGYMNLVFILKQERIIDIYTCTNMYEKNEIYVCYELEYEHGKPETHEYHSISVAADEKADFIPSSYYLYYISKCDQACAQLNVYRNQVIPVEVIIEWVQKHQNVLNVFVHASRDAEMKYLFCFFESFVEELHFREVARQAIDAMTFNPEKDKDELINWLIIYEKLGSVELVLLSMRDFEYVNDHILIRTNGYLSFLMRNEEVGPLFHFCDIFNNYYWKLLEDFKNAYPHLNLKQEEEKLSTYYFHSKFTVF